MKKILGILMLAGLALGGCGKDPCEEAADKVKDCNLPGGSSTSGTSGDCSGTAECNAKCINDATCAELTDLNSKFFECVAKCGP